MLKLFNRDWKILKDIRDSAIRMFKYDFKIGTIFKLFCFVCSIQILSFLLSTDIKPQLQFLKVSNYPQLKDFIKVIMPLE